LQIIQKNQQVKKSKMSLWNHNHGQSHPGMPPPYKRVLILPGMLPDIKASLFLNRELICLGNLKTTLSKQEIASILTTNGLRFPENGGIL
jgi:hypothetical protein